MRSILIVGGVSLAGSLFATTAYAKVPFFNASCPGHVEVHSDEGGPVYIGGKEAKLKRFNDNYYEARLGNLTVSVTVNPDGSPDISYTGKGGANGVCQLKAAPGAQIDRQSQDLSAPKHPHGADGMAMGSLRAFCRGEASAKFGVRPAEITTNMAFKSGKRIAVQGHYPNGDGDKFFNCWFDGAGNFLSVN